MPVIWFTGFNGMATEMTDTKMRLTNSDQYSGFVAKEVDNYVGRSVGSIVLNGVRIQQNAPYIRMFCRKAGSSSNYGSGYLQGHIISAPWDATKRALAIAMVKTSSSGFNSFGGFAFQTPNASAGKSYRVGFRFYAMRPTIYTTLFNLFFSNMAGTPVFFFSENPWNSNDDFETPIYFEIEWDVPTQTVTVFKNGVQVADRDMSANTLNGGFAIHTELYHSGSSFSGMENKWFAMSDMYWQTIESEADVALGPGTVVAAARPEEDDVVEFTRPDAYGSNAAVVSAATSTTGTGGITANSTSRYLTGEAAGQQDLYTLNLSSVTSAIASVEAVTVRTAAYNPGTIPMSFGVIAKSGEAQVDPAEPITVNPGETSYIMNSVVLTSDPSDGTRWTTAKLADLRVGTKLVS